jgi:hypothetical protein
MRTKIGLILAAGLLWAMPAMAQGSSDLREISPRDLYVALYVTESGIRCTTPGDYSDEARDRINHNRFLKIRPWLVAAIGEAEFETLKKNLLDEEGDVDYFGCPSDEYLWRLDYRHNRILQEMERRARIALRTKG